MINLMPELISFILSFMTTFVVLVIFRKKIIQTIRDLNIVYKITASFIFVAIIPAVVISFISFSNARNIIISQSINNLENIAELKKVRVTEFFEGLEKDMLVAQDYFNVKNNLPIVNKYINDKDHPNYIEAKKNLDGQLKTLQQSKGFLEFILLNNEGKVAYHTGNIYSEKELGEIFEVNSIYEENKLDSKVVFSEIFMSEYFSSGLEMVVAAPAYDFEGSKIGHIVFAVDMSPVYEFIQDTTGLGETGEIAIGEKVQPHAGHSIGGHSSDVDVPHTFFLNPLRHDIDSALERTVVIGSQLAIPMQEASQGREGSGISVDYRGEKVVAAWRYIPKTDWGLVAKVDVSEEFRPIYFLQNITFAVVGLSLVVVLILSYILSRTISQPIINLSSAMSSVNNKGITSSKVSFIKNISKDEIGNLATSFKEMVLNLKTSSEELGEKVEHLEKFQEITTDRELKMVKLKEEIAKLKKRLPKN